MTIVTRCPTSKRIKNAITLKPLFRTNSTFQKLFIDNFSNPCPCGFNTNGTTFKNTIAELLGEHTLNNDNQNK